MDRAERSCEKSGEEVRREQIRKGNGAVGDKKERMEVEEAAGISTPHKYRGLGCPPLSKQSQNKQFTLLDISYHLFFRDK